MANYLKDYPSLKQTAPSNAVLATMSSNEKSKGDANNTSYANGSVSEQPRGTEGIDPCFIWLVKLIP